MGSGGGSGRGRSVMGDGTPGEQESPYRTSFEKVFLKQSEEFYARESAVLLLECDAPTFLQKVRPRSHFPRPSLTRSADRQALSRRGRPRPDLPRTFDRTPPHQTPRKNPHHFAPLRHPRPPRLRPPDAHPGLSHRRPRASVHPLRPRSDGPRCAPSGDLGVDRAGRAAGE